MIQEGAIGYALEGAKGNNTGRSEGGGMAHASIGRNEI